MDEVIEIKVTEEELAQIVKTGRIKVSVEGTDQFKYLYRGDYWLGE